MCGTQKASRHSSKHQDAFSASAIQTGDYACAGAPTGNTIIMFASDNGPHQEGGHKVDFFDSNGDLRGKKREWEVGQKGNYDNVDDERSIKR